MFGYFMKMAIAAAIVSSLYAIPFILRSMRKAAAARKEKKQ